MSQFPPCRKANDLLEIFDRLPLEGTQRWGFFDWTKAAVRAIHFQACCKPFHLDRFRPVKAELFDRGGIHQNESLLGVGKPHLVVNAVDQSGQQLIFLPNGRQQMVGIPHLFAFVQVSSDGMSLPVWDVMQSHLRLRELLLQLLYFTQELPL